MIGLLSTVQAQYKGEIIEVAGLTLNGEGAELKPVSFTTVGVKGTARGTVANYQGLFSIVAHKGDILVFSSIGYKTVEFIIPDTTKGDRLSMVQLMVTDVYNLPQAVIFPWPDKDHLKIEFLAMEPEANIMEETAKKNLDAQKMEELRENMKPDGRETATRYGRQYATNMTFYGQRPPMNIFNPLAWAQFFNAWKKGQFKKKPKSFEK
jgi:hypothetical protein